MRACATASAICAGFMSAVALFSACSSGSAPSQVPEQTPETTSTSAAPGPGTAAAPADPTAAAPAETAAAPKAPKKPPETVADCKELISDITNDPPSGGVVMNNATTGPDAGSSDRLQPILEMVKARRDGFRCCFDLYARKHPGAQGKLAFTIKLKPDGSLMEARIKKDESDITAPEVESCMTDLAKGIAWPRSPSGKETTYTHRFEFKPRQ